MYSITCSLPLPGLVHLINTDSNCYRPLHVSPQAGDTAQATTSNLLGNGGGLEIAPDASDMSNTAKFDDDIDEFRTIHDGFETKATIGGLYFLVLDAYILLTMLETMGE